VVTIEIPVEIYDDFTDKCDQDSREYTILKNGIIFRRPKRDERFVRIECSMADANKLLNLAVKICPSAFADISRGITATLGSP
jgi:hypothetical protein